MDKLSFVGGNRSKHDDFLSAIPTLELVNVGEGAEGVTP
jgi:hypothetical protein